uniref:TonB-dependent transporter Oar-like beta-barrel domain-containing protein n=1 Tax=Solibacter usitatus (strain Ellin6076) TaxID=234267 RepID=Q01VH0_SOLUE
MTYCRLCMLAALLSFPLGLSAQVTSTASLSGTVSDATGSVVPNAVIRVTHLENGTTYNSVTGSNGAFTVPSLPTGLYNVTAAAKGFKQETVSNVKMDAGVPASVQIRLEVGSQTEVVTVEASAAVLQTQSATVNTSLMGRQIVELPLVSREALDLALTLPGVTTPGRPRTSTVNGLAKGAINITMDGVNVQDNNGKSTDGFYTYVRPRLDAVEEVTVSTGAAGADSNGEGAIQIKFVTRSGSNDFHGSLYEYHRNPALNANYWFNNRDLAPDPRTGKAPNTRVLLNQYGGRAGGPVYLPKVFNGRNRAFFFVNYEEFRLPEQSLRTRTIFNPLTQNGVFQYGTQKINLLSLAAANGQTSTIDPTIAALLAQISATTAHGSVSPGSDPNIDRFTFINTGGQVRKFATARFDVNLNSRNSLEFSWNYQHLFYTGEQVDFLNNSDPAFPGFPNKGSIPSRRFSGVVALRSTITSHIVNELRSGLQGGTITFFPEVNSAQFANQQGFNLGINAAGVTSATVQTGPNRNNTPTKNVTDNLTVSRNAHSMSFGMSFTQVNRWAVTQTPVPAVTLGVDTTDPASAMFTTTNFPGASSTDLTNARNVYGVLTGRITAITANANLSESGKYVYAGPSTQRYQQREMGYYANDSWHARKNLTINYGLRWEVQFPYEALNNRFTFATPDALYGVSGAGNLFKPGVLTGQPTVYNPLRLSQHAYNTQWRNLAPSIGLAWSPDVDNSPLHWLFGRGGKSVLRAGYSVAYDREGNSAFSALANNPGGFVSAARSLTLGNLVTGTGSDTLPLLLRQTSRLGPPAFPDAPSYPMPGSVSNSVNVIDPGLKMPYVQSWSVGIQREVTRNTVVEVRYVGNHLSRQWTTENLNEVNVVENGFLNEFQLAQANLLANIAAGRGSTFRYFGAGTGTSPLPITLAYASGIPAAQAGDASKYTSTLFSNTSYVNALAINQPATATFISNLSTNSAAQRANAAAAGLPANFFQVNPGVSAANLLTNLGGSSYNAGTLDVRRRLTKGLQFDANYTYSKGMTSVFTSLRAPLSRGLSPLNITHGFKMNWIYELPLGHGKPLLGNAHGALDRIVGGWSLNGTGRVQSGSAFSMGNVRLVGMTRSELQSAVGMRFNDGAKIAYFLPQDIIDNTIKAFNTSATSANGYGAAGAPTGRYIAPASAGSCIEVYNGQCGGTSLILYGPHLTRFDMSIVKKTRISERVNVELRGEFLNAFNNINFLVGSPNNDTNTATNFSNAAFGQVTQAYNDQSTTYDPGGRLIQFVMRINF